MEQTSMDASPFFSYGGAALTSNRDDWETPSELFMRLDRFWHFDLDVAASDQNHLCAQYFTKDDDGLSKSWAGHRVWCNPPYGRNVSAWVRKAYEETRDGATLVIMLVPARVDTTWYHDWIQGKAAEVKFLRGRLKYALGGSRRVQRLSRRCLCAGVASYDAIDWRRRMIIEFGAWRLVPVDARNWELCHLHVTSKGKNAGERRWHHLGRFYQYNTIGNALWYAATMELADHDDVAVMETREALSEFERIANNLMRDAEKCVQKLVETRSGPLARNHD